MWHIPNPWHIQNPEIFRSSTVLRSMSDILQKLWKEVPGYNYFCTTLLPRHFQQDSKCVYLSLNGTTYLAQLFQVLFQAFSDIFEHHSRAFSRIFRTLCITGIFRTLAYSYYKIYTDSKVYSQYHITHFQKSSPWTFDTLLNVSPSLSLSLSIIVAI